MGEEDGFRAKLGEYLIKGSTIALVILIVMIMGAAIWAQFNDDKGAVMDAAKLLLTALLPLFGTWVGTVLTYYYSAKNFETANRGMMDVVRNATQKLAAASVADTMIPRGRIVTLKLAAQQTLQALPLTDIEKRFDAIRISRLMILDANDTFAAMLHRSIWMEMLYLGSKDNPPVTVATGTLGTLLVKTFDGQSFQTLATTAIAFVGRDRSVADAKAAMEAVPGCQDVIVTQNGRATDPVLGWITNVDISRVSQA